MSTPEVPVPPPEQPAAPTAATGGYAGLRLPDFWSDAPAGWFLYAESRFRIRNITSEVDRFDHLVGALPKSSVRLVMDTLESLDADQPYSALKQRLLASHELSEFQRIELLFKMEPLGSRKPSELLSHMLEICPRGEERNHFFIFLFLQRLPKELRSHLNDSEQDPVKLAPRRTASGRSTAMSSTDRSTPWRRKLKTPPSPPSSRPAARDAAVAASGPAGAGAAAGAAGEAPPPPSRSQRRTALSTWQRRRRVCASTTGTTATRPGIATSPAVGETEAQGVPQRRRPRPPGPHCGPIV
jgi:hypothetical protein